MLKYVHRSKMQLSTDAKAKWRHRQGRIHLSNLSQKLSQRIWRFRATHCINHTQPEHLNLAIWTGGCHGSWLNHEDHQVIPLRPLWKTDRQPHYNHFICTRFFAALGRSQRPCLQLRALREPSRAAASQERNTVQVGYMLLIVSYCCVYIGHMYTVHSIRSNHSVGSMQRTDSKLPLGRHWQMTVKGIGLERCKSEPDFPFTMMLIFSQTWIWWTCRETLKYVRNIGRILSRKNSDFEWEFARLALATHHPATGKRRQLSGEEFLEFPWSYGLERCFEICLGFKQKLGATKHANHANPKGVVVHSEIITITNERGWAIWRYALLQSSTTRKMAPAGHWKFTSRRSSTSKALEALEFALTATRAKGWAKSTDFWTIWTDIPRVSQWPLASLVWCSPHFPKQDWHIEWWILPIDRCPILH